MKLLIEQTDAQRILDYLVGCPFKDVFQLVPLLTNAPVETPAEVACESADK